MGFSDNKVEPLTSSNVELFSNSFISSVKNKICAIYMNNMFSYTVKIRVDNYARKYSVLYFSKTVSVAHFFKTAQKITRAYNEWYFPTNSVSNSCHAFSVYENERNVRKY